MNILFKLSQESGEMIHINLNINQKIPYRTLLMVNKKESILKKIDQNGFFFVY